MEAEAPSLSYLIVLLKSVFKNMHTEVHQIFQILQASRVFLFTFPQISIH